MGPGRRGRASADERGVPLRPRLPNQRTRGRPARRGLDRRAAVGPRLGYRSARDVPDHGAGRAGGAQPSADPRQRRGVRHPRPVAERPAHDDHAARRPGGPAHVGREGGVHRYRGPTAGRPGGPDGVQHLGPLDPAGRARGPGGDLHRARRDFLPPDRGQEPHRPGGGAAVLDRGGTGPAAPAKTAGRRRGRRPPAQPDGLARAAMLEPLGGNQRSRYGPGRTADRRSELLRRDLDRAVPGALGRGLRRGRGAAGAGPASPGRSTRAHGGSPLYWFPLPGPGGDRRLPGAPHPQVRLLRASHRLDGGRSLPRDRPVHQDRPGGHLEQHRQLRSQAVLRPLRAAVHPLRRGGGGRARPAGRAPAAERNQPHPGNGLVHLRSRRRHRGHPHGHARRAGRPLLRHRPRRAVSRGHPPSTRPGG